MKSPLLWLDLETTGTDEHKDSIIEIGCVLTDDQLNQLGEFASFVRPTDEAIGRLTRTKVVADMHRANGLYDEIVGDHTRLPHPNIVDNMVLDWIQDIVGNEPPVLAGSGVAHFDRRFLKTHMPRLDQHLRHWCIDVGVIRRFFRLSTGCEFRVAAENIKTHRAIDDAYLHLAEGREMQRYFRDAEELFGEHT